MSTKLTAANRYLRDAAVREVTVTKSVVTSSAIEGIRAAFNRRTATAGSRKKYVTTKKS